MVLAVLNLVATRAINSAHRSSATRIELAAAAMFIARERPRAAEQTNGDASFVPKCGLGVRLG